MDNALSLSVTPLQVFFALAFYAWLIVFPIILMRKISRLEQLIEEHWGSADEPNEEPENV